MLDLDLGTRLRACAGLFAATSLLAACGGGGGGSSPPAPAAPPSGVSATSGLVPGAPVPGATLEADATTLRILRPGATWTYHGADQPGGSGTAVNVYANVVTQVAAGAGVNELSSNQFAQGADVSVEEFDSGNVDSPQSLQPSPAVAAEAVVDTELRSPVRVGDQYTIYDKHLADAGRDLDGDGKNESLDAAVWSRVVGTEVIDLPNRREVTAVRVDTTVAQRVHYSKTGTTSDVVQTIRHVWYAKGVGIVKQQLDEPADFDPSIRHLVTETLDTWDGLTAGLGALPVKTAVIPSGESAGQSPQYPIDAVAFDDHAVVMNLIPGTYPADGVTFVTVDLTGQVTGSTNQHGSAIGEKFFEAQRVFRMGSELRVVASGFTDATFLVGFDANGQSMTLPPVSLLANTAVVSDGSNDPVQSSAAGNRLWLMWLNRHTDDPDVADLVMQPFDASGQPVAAAVVLEHGVNPQTIQAMRMSSAADRTIASWGDGGLVQTQHYAVADTSSGALLAIKTITPAAAVTADPVSGSYVALQPLALGNGLVLTFDDDLVSGQLDGLALDASLDAIRSTNGGLGAEAISPSWLLPETAPLTVSGSGSVFFGVPGEVTLWPEDSQATGVTTIAALTPGSGALATTSSTALLARIPGLTATQLLPYGDRVLVVGTKSNALAVTAAWRAN